MKKRIISIAIICLFIGVNTVSAKASASISVSTTSTIVGNSGTATLTVSSDDVLGQIYGTFSCGGLGSKDLKYVNSDGAAIKSKSYTISWTAKSTGTYTCSVSGLQVGTLSHPEDGVYSVGANTKTITVTSASNSSGGASSGGTTSEKKNYSSDNTLSSLEIEEQEINPKFDKGTTEYSLSLDQSVEKIKINAKANDSKATVSGTGEVVLSDGENNLEVKVTAENGNEKIYKIKVTVEDKNPIIVTIDNENYTVMKKNNNIIDKLDGYEEGTMKINDQDVINYTNANNHLTLVILKDNEGKVAYYIYDNGKYILYDENTFNTFKLFLLEMPKNMIPDGYSKFNFTYNEKKYDGYKLDKVSDYYLIYAMNLENGEKGLYIYDSKMKTVSRYDDGIEKYYSDKSNNDIKLYKTIIIGIIGAIVGIVIVMIIISIVKSNKRKQKNKKSNLK